jgi:hypothetical protein
VLFDVGGVDFQALRQVVSRIFNCFGFTGCHYGISNDPLVCFVPVHFEPKTGFTQRRKVHAKAQSGNLFCVFASSFSALREII